MGKVERTYVVVHEFCVQKEGLRTEEEMRVADEIRRIREKERHFIVTKNPSIIPEGLDPNHFIFVCGAYHSTSRGVLCVDQQLVALTAAGFNARIHFGGTLSRGENPAFRKKAYGMV